jgi:dihydropteroate synthase
MKLLARGRTVGFPRRPLIMGIVNLCVDSFSGDGLTSVDAAMARAREMVAEGADIIDIGGESAGTRRAAMSEPEEIAALLPFVRRFKTEALAMLPADTTQLFPPLLSINTWRPGGCRRKSGAGRRRRSAQRHRRPAD